MKGWIGKDSRPNVSDKLLIVFASGEMETAEIELKEAAKIEDIISPHFYEMINKNSNLKRWHPNDVISEVYVEFDLLAESGQFISRNSYINNETSVKENKTTTFVIPKCKQRHLIHYFDFIKRNADYFVNDKQIAMINEGVITRL